MKSLLRIVLACAAALTHASASAQQPELRLGDVVIRHVPQQERLARALLPTSQSALVFPGLPADILMRGSDVNVFLAPDEAQFDSLTGGRAPEWGAGVAFPQQGLIILPGYISDRAVTQELPRILRHELAHVALQRHLGDARIPRWFTEGFATWTAGQLDGDAGWQLRLALATNRAPALDSLTLDWPLLAVDAQLAYLLSASAMEYLYSLSTPETFERFLDRWAETGNFEETLRETYIVSSPQFERLWRAQVKRRYGWVQILVQTAFIWIVVGLLVIALFVIRRRRDRARMERLRQTELPDEPAYWLEPPPEAATPAAEGDAAPPPPPNDPGRPPS